MFEEENLLENLTVFIEPAAKRKKVNHETDLDTFHSSLVYNSIKAPPLVEYKSIDSYCETKLSEYPKSQAGLQQDNDMPSNLKISDIQSISSPIVFKTPINKGRKSPPKSKPFNFYSVEELSLITSLKNWTNNKVCPVGSVFLDTTTGDFYLQSVNEVGKWQVLLDHSSLSEVPPVEKLLQVFGTVEIVVENPIIKIAFFRLLKSADLALLIESYKQMEKYLPSFVCQSKGEDTSVKEAIGSPTFKTPQMNETLDGYSFSELDNLQ